VRHSSDVMSQACPDPLSIVSKASAQALHVASICANQMT